MQTLYIDVYFLINFCVDILALYFAASFAKIPSSNLRIFISALVGGAYAVVGILLLEESFLMYPISVIIFIAMVLISAWRVSFYRMVKYALALFLFQIILGGLVYYAYCLLDGLMKDNDYVSESGVNRNLLVLSLIVLLSIGVLKLIVSVFGSSRLEKNIKLEMDYANRTIAFEAFIDSGNLAVDPLDSTPVMLIKLSLAERIFGKDLIGGDFNSEKSEIKKRLRIIPLSFGSEKKILYGIRTDGLYAIKGKTRHGLSVVIAIDKDGKDYGGYFALMPISAIDGVL